MIDPVLRDQFEATYVTLMDHKPQTIPMLNVMKHGHVDHCYLYNDSVVLTYGHEAMVSTDCEEDLCILLQAVEDPKSITSVYCAQENWMEFPADYFQCDQSEGYYQFTTQTPPPVFECPYPIRPIDSAYLDTVCQVYERFQEGDDPSYLESRLDAGAAFGAFDGDKLIGFIFTHSDWSLGGLEVLPEYRHRGLAAALESALMRHLFEKLDFRYCHCQVALDNKASLQLQWKLGMKLCDDNVVWLWRKNEWVDPDALREEQELRIPKEDECCCDHDAETDSCSCGCGHDHQQ